jgi:hypothetical protein
MQGEQGDIGVGERLRGRGHEPIDIRARRRLEALELRQVRAVE